MTHARSGTCGFETIRKAHLQLSEANGSFVRVAAISHEKPELYRQMTGMSPKRSRILARKQCASRRRAAPDTRFLKNPAQPPFAPFLEVLIYWFTAPFDCWVIAYSQFD